MALIGLVGGALGMGTRVTVSGKGETMMRVAAALAALLVLLALGGMDPAALAPFGPVVLGALALGVLGNLLGLWPVRRGARKARPAGTRQRKAAGPTIIVDGSNVMHWGGEPSPMVLARVVKEIVAQGHRPHVYFDANVSYKLFDRFMDEAAMARVTGVQTSQVTIVPGGTPADPVLLAHAVSAGVRVVTNDRFRDWKDQFPRIADRHFLVRGEWRQGTPMLRL